MKKLLYSPGYGAGWSTWAGDNVAVFAATYQPIIDRLEAGGKVDVELLAQFQLDLNTYADPPIGATETYFYTGGAENLKVWYGNDDVQYSIREYDGNEYVEVVGSGRVF